MINNIYPRITSPDYLYLFINNPGAYFPHPFLGQRQGIHTNRGRARVFDVLQGDGRRQIDVGQHGRTATRSGEIGTAQIGTDEAGFAQLGAAEVGAAEVRSVEIGGGEIGSGEVGAVEVGAVEASGQQVGAAVNATY